MASPSISSAPDFSATVDDFDLAVPPSIETGLVVKTSYSIFKATTYDLTTTFTPPAWCFAPTYTVSPGRNDSVTAGVQAKRGYHPECFPAGFFGVESFTKTYSSGFTAEQSSYVVNSAISEAVSEPIVIQGITVPGSYYSPGVCPSGYVSAAGVYDGKNHFDTCCPSSMSVIDSSCSGGAATITVIEGANTRVQTVRQALAPSIVVAYQSSDLSLWASPGSTSTPTAATTSRPTDTMNLPTTTSAPGLSTGAKAGIGTGAAGVVIVALIVLGLVIRKRRKGSNRDTSSYTGKAELSGDGVHRELNGEGAVYEKNSFVKPVEIDNDSPAELDGDWRGWEVGSPQRHLTVSERNI